MHSVLVGDGAPIPVGADRPVGKFLSVDHNLATDPRGSGKLRGDSVDGLRRNGGNFGYLLQRIVLDVLLEQLEARLSLLRPDLELPLQRALGSLDLVVWNCFASLGILHERLAASIVPYVETVRANQIGGIGMSL